VLAGVLAVRDGPGDAERAEQLARRAEDRAARMGMVLPSHPPWLKPGEFTVRTTERSRDASLQRCPGGWRLLVDGRATLLPDRVGLTYLVELIARPDREVDVVSLASEGLMGVTAADAVADPAALDSYRRRAQELRTLLQSREAKSAAAIRYQKELQALDDVLRSSTGLGGRSRSFPDTNERARTAVRKALMRAVDSIESIEPDLGHHLHASLTTGVTCRYSPSRGWSVTTAR
jgi:hypothetical protein